MLVKNCSCLKSYQTEKTTFHLECKNRYWSPLPCGSRFQGQSPTSNVEPGSMLQCKSFISIFSHLCRVKYVWAISWQFPFSQSFQIPESWNPTTFPLDPPWNSPPFFYLFSFQLLLNSEIPSLKTGPLLLQLFKFLEFKFKAPVRNIISYCCSPKFGKHAFTHRIQSTAIFVLPNVYTCLNFHSYWCVFVMTSDKLKSFSREVPQ